MVRQKADALVRLLFLLSAAEPGNCRKREGGRGKHTKQPSGDQKCAVEAVALFGLIDISRNDGNGTTVDEDGNVSLRVERWPIGGFALFHIDDRPINGQRMHRISTESRQLDLSYSMFGYQLRVTFTVVDFVTEHLARSLSPLEKRHAGIGRLLAGGNLLKIANTLCQQPGPVLSRRSCIPVQQMLGRCLHDSRYATDDGA